jgi:hypothetical protein
MPKHRSKIVKELEPQCVEGVTEAQRQYYESIGFRPYLNSRDEIVWLSPAHHGFRINAKHKLPLYRRIFTKKIPQPAMKRRRRNWMAKFFVHNWLLLLILFALMAFVLL